MTIRQLRDAMDSLWLQFWTGGITNPLTVIEQITFLMFARLLDITETTNERIAKRTGREFTPIFREKEQHLRWHRFKNLPGQEMLELVRDEVFRHFRHAAVDGATFGEYMKDAQLMIQKASLMEKAVEMISELPLTDSDSKGDLYEYLLSKLTTAGINGQFRTPRHIIRKMVEIIDPQVGEVVGDPACGTAGFLAASMHYVLEKNTSKEGAYQNAEGEWIYTGDLLTQDQLEYLRGNMLHGFDFDSTMLRISAMNLLLHGLDSPGIHYQDTMSSSFTDRFPKLSKDAFDVILANPPFKGTLDYEDVHPALLSDLKTKKTELLFVALILHMLKPGGRCAMIVPDGVLFGSTKAHVKLRKMLVEENQLDAVIKLPSGVFKPYAGVSTAVLVFTKAGETRDVFFYDVKADGYSLDDKREPVDENDLPELIERWNKKDPKKDTDRTDQAFFVSKKDIKSTKYDLSLNRYKEIVYKEEKYLHPKEIIYQIKALEKQISNDLIELEGMLK